MTEYEERFWRKVAKSVPDECWLWQGAKNTRDKRHLDYGMVWKSEGRTWLKAHRVAWELVNGAIPEGLNVLHRCDVPLCVNPSHLFLGTKADNNRDRAAKGRGIFGEGHHKSKLNEADVREIRRRYAAGGNVSAIASAFGVVDGTIWFIVRRIHWKHVA